MSTLQAPVVAVLLGTDHHPFPRLVDWVAQRVADGGTSWFVQHGATPLPSWVPGVPVLAMGGMAELLERADAVVTHGGPGLIMDAVGAGHRPIAVPRMARLGEHVDDHQVAFVRRMAGAGVVTAVDGPGALDRAVRDAVGRRRGRATHVPVPSARQRAAVARFGSLVDDLVRHG